MELGQCLCVVQGNMALSADVSPLTYIMCDSIVYLLSMCSCVLQIIDERFFLVFPDRLIILAVGASLSGYELKVYHTINHMTSSTGYLTCTCRFCIMYMYMMY